MWTTPKRLWLDATGKVTDKAKEGVELLAGEWDRVALSLEDAKRLGLTGKATKAPPLEESDAPAKEGVSHEQ